MLRVCPETGVGRAGGWLGAGRGARRKPSPTRPTRVSGRTLRRIGAVLAILGLFAATRTAAYALINPNFTPVHLVEKAELILVVKIKPPDANGSRCAMEIVKCLKGKMPDNRQVLDLSKTANQEHAKAIRKMLADQQGQLALLYVGKGEKDEPIARLHVGGKWIALDKQATAAPQSRTGTGAF